MGAMLMTGLACLGASLGIAVVVASVRKPADVPTRRLVIILLAFPQGIAVLGVVVGLLAIFTDKLQAPMSASLAAGPAIIGSVSALAVLFRQQDGDPALVTIGRAYVTGLGVLGTVVWLLAMTVEVVAPSPLTDWPFLILGPVAGVAALAIGLTGARSIPLIAGVTEERANAVISAQVARIVPFELLGFGAGVIAIVLVMGS